MFYFFHATDIKSLKKILKKDNIYASKYLPKKYHKLSGSESSKCVHTNIYHNGIPLRHDEQAGIGEITIIIDPKILAHRTGYFNLGWMAEINENSIKLNSVPKLKSVINYLIENYKYPFILTHEVLFRKKIPAKYIKGIICSNHLREKVRKYLEKYDYDNVKIFDRFPNS